MLKYVVAYAAAKLVLGAVVVGLTSANIEVPDSISNVSTIVATSCAMYWFIKRENRKLAKSEIFAFGGGAAIFDLLLTTVWIIATIILTEASFSAEGLAQALGGGLSGAEVAVIMSFSVVFGSLMTFAMSAFFAWIMTRKLPDTHQAVSADFE